MCVCLDVGVHPERLLRGRCEPQVCRKRSVLVKALSGARCPGRTHTLLNAMTGEACDPCILSACGCALHFCAHTTSPVATLEVKVSGLGFSALWLRVRHMVFEFPAADELVISPYN